MSDKKLDPMLQAALDHLVEERMTLAVGNKLIKCDDAGVPVKNEAYVLFEITRLDMDPEQPGTYAPIAYLRKLPDPVEEPASDAGE